MRFLKKTMKIDLETEDLAIIDESRCQNTTNTARRFCNPTINGVRDPNRLIKTGNNISGLNGDYLIKPQINYIGISHEKIKDIPITIVIVIDWRKIWSKWCWFSRNQLFIGYFLQSEK